MTDEIDLQVERDQKLLDILVLRRKPVPLDKGYCLNCEEELPVGRYCDADCREDYEQRQRFQARPG